MDYLRLDEICEINMGQSPSSDSYNEEGKGIPFFQGNADFGEIYPTVRIWCNKPTKVVNEGTLLISVRAPIGALNFAKERSCIGRGLAGITVKNGFELKYIYYNLKYKKEELNNKGTGSTFKAISKASLGELLIKNISVEKQKECIKRLDLVHKIINEEKEQIKKFDTLIKSRFVEMFGDITEKIALKESCTLHARIGWQALTKKEHQKIGDYMLVTGTDFIDGKIDFSNCVYISKNRYDMDENIQIKNDDILITKDGTIGKVAIVEKLPMPATLNAGIFVVRPDKRFNKEYISYVFKGPLFEQFVNRVKTGSTIKHLNQGKLVQFEIPLPDMDMQNEFAKLYMQIGKSELAVKSSLEKLETLKKSLMQQYFG